MKNVKQLLAADDGAAAVIVAVLAVALIGMVALVVDLGAVYQAHASVQNAADAAALSGAISLTPKPGYVAPGSLAGTARAAALSTSRMNARGAPVAKAVSTFVSHDTIEVDVTDEVDLLFAPILGLRSWGVQASASAVVKTPAGAGSGPLPPAMPFGILESEAQGLSFGQELVLKDGGGGNSQCGNFGLLSPNGGNAPKDIAGIITAGGTAMRVGQTMSSMTGNKVGPIARAAKARCTSGASFESVVGAPDQNGMSRFEPGGESNDRIVVIPVIKGNSWPTGSGSVQVSGFMFFFVTNINETGDSGQIDGRFFRPLLKASEITEPGPLTPYGPMAYQLVR